MKNIFIFFFALFSFLQLKAQEFNGRIDFKYYTLKDTTNNIYFVKDKIVKLDNFVKTTPVMEGSYVFDLALNKIKFVSVKRKLWGEHTSVTPPPLKGVCEVIKGKNTKTLNGIKCKEYIVKNNEENTEITYWMAEEKFNFFIPMMKLWNGKYRQSVYFNKIADLPTGSMPMKSVEKRISDGKVISILEVVKINKKKPDEASLQIPADYSKVE
jgi:hypothetical protein